MKKNKKFNLQKGIKLTALGLIAPITISISGCTNNTNKNETSNENEITSSQNIDETNNENEITSGQNIDKTSNYALVRLDGNIYLTQIYKTINDDYSVIEYYDINTNEFVGESLEYNKVYTSSEKETVNDKYFNGEYGYGKLLPECAIVNLHEFIKEKYPTEEELEFYSSNSSELKDEFENLIIYKDKTDGYINSSNNYNLNFYRCYNTSDRYYYYIGYRIDFRLIYDIRTGTIYNVEDYLVSENKYSNNENKSIATIKKDIEEYYNKINSIINDDFDDTSETEYKASELYVLDTSDRTVIYTLGECQKYYFLAYEGIYEEENVILGRDILNKNGYAICRSDFAVNDYYNERTKEYVKAYGVGLSGDDVIYFNAAMKPIDEFLTEKGYDDLVKYSYTKKELEEINEFLISEQITLSRSK